ncbi:glycosyltransferase [Cyclobacterium marinum]|uniref:Glycosyl transferase family 2 n=1 Tax=Cyclobacterium marinum (strain ATCC 25205 / DSM 745 / LMG 13164 / NCIMB 1802) TaxID=880070 RepID=G0J6R4_CYCMS|nr:glycosyltransferase [Cyclobacterium marinum]AEL26112.1 glycosyl transferase family 2 [Cyclobacterium marinum DSM 745]MBI0399469.1 glycosyltransferase [Cyclobacterium marinum]MBR9777651.1 glycosyltransferase [Cytophagales bacterium]|tara:strand:- start:4775 stop:5902 length:1128 start_codon:yes stop_codon:yes gene_type:complete
MENTLWWIFFLASGLQFTYLMVVFGRFAFFHKRQEEIGEDLNLSGVSVIIAAKNEAAHLNDLIPLLMEQDYPIFEVLVVNDCSTDESEDLLRSLSGKYDKLKIVNIRYTPQHVTAKKYALTLGIKVSKYETILLTDADCRPVSSQWIRRMSAPIRNEGKTFALGHGSYLTLPGLLNKIIQYETLLTAIYYFSFGYWKSPFMGVGRNLCYRKDFFMEKKAFKSLWHIEGGDDDLFVNKYATATNTAIVAQPDSITISQPKTNFKDYFTQKKRHFHAGKYYRNRDKLKLGLYSLSHLVFWASAIGIVILESTWEPIALVLGLVFSRAMLQYLIIHRVRKKLEGTGKVIWTIFFDLMYMIYFWTLGTKGYLSKTVKWK